MASDPLHRLTGPPAEDENNSWARRLKKAMGYPPFERLTPRELQVIELVAQGKSNKEIARALCVTSHTAKAHISSILQKLAVESRTEAAVMWTSYSLRSKNEP